MAAYHVYVDKERRFLGIATTNNARLDASMYHVRRAHDEAPDDDVPFDQDDWTMTDVWLGEDDKKPVISLDKVGRPLHVKVAGNAVGFRCMSDKHDSAAALHSTYSEEMGAQATVVCTRCARPLRVAAAVRCEGCQQCLYCNELCAVAHWAQGHYVDCDMM